ncbi:MAG: thioredoxin family protein [Candidatus Dadabacteria bacterium]|nr:MAG: thioredoxin family protein [Candidatus Dadabacteria bacterium]
MERTETSTRFPLGSKLPDFKLKNVDGREMGSEYLREGKAALVVFTCNHCPYVKGSEQMLCRIARRFEGQGLRTVTINSNDATRYPEDSFDKMKEKAAQMGLPYPYLYDSSQEVARMFDAACTPECFLFNSKGELVYQGAINDNPKDPGQVNQDYLSVAVTQVLAGVKPDPAFVHPLGCSIKWRR